MVGGLRTLDANTGGSPLGVLTDAPGRGSFKSNTLLTAVCPPHQHARESVHP